MIFYQVCCEFNAPLLIFLCYHCLCHPIKMFNWCQLAQMSILLLYALSSLSSMHSSKYDIRMSSEVTYCLRLTCHHCLRIWHRNLLPDGSDSGSPGTISACLYVAGCIACVFELCLSPLLLEGGPSKSACTGFHALREVWIKKLPQSLHTLCTLHSPACVAYDSHYFLEQSCHNAAWSTCSSYR